METTFTSQHSPLPEGCPQDGVSLRTPRTKRLSINGTLLLSNPILQLPYNPQLKERARKLRQARNLSEVLFWKQVNKRSFHNIDFDRQRVIGNYIVDFYVKQLGLIIEIDGSSHVGKEDYDKVREDYLRSLHLNIFRISAADILNNLGPTMLSLERYIIEQYKDLNNT